MQKYPSNYHEPQTHHAHTRYLPHDNLRRSIAHVYARHRMIHLVEYRNADHRANSVVQHVVPVSLQKLRQFPTLAYW